MWPSYDSPDVANTASPKCLDLQYLDCSPDLDSRPATRENTDSARFLSSPSNFVFQRYEGSINPDVHG